MTPRTRFSAVTTALALLLLAFMAVLAGGAARRESVTIDEVAHIGAGVSYLQRLDMRINGEHPPLAKVLAAIPLIMRGVRADYAHVSWTFSNGFFQSILGEWSFGNQVITHWNDPVGTIFWARLPMLLLTLVLGWVLFLYGCRLGNSWSGLLCLSAYVSTPAFLVFGPLVLTDIGVTLFAVLAIWTFADMWGLPSPANTGKFAFALAGALLSKFSAGLLFFAFIAFALSLRWFPIRNRLWQTEMANETERRARQRRGWRSLRKGTLLAAVITYVAYLVLSWNQPTGALEKLGYGNGPALLLLRRLLMPPFLYLRGLLAFALQASRPTFILGHSYPHGVWFYFPVVFLLKSPLALLLLLLFAAAIAVLVKIRLGSRSSAFLKVEGCPAGQVVAEGRELHWRAVWVSLGVFTAACMLSRLDLSIRHFSIPLALLILLLAPLPCFLEALRGWSEPLARAGVIATALLAIASLATAARAYPYYFAFINSLSMGRPAYHLINDSNLDWNQALPEVEQFAAQHRLNRILVDEYGFTDPAVYVSGAQAWSCQQPSSQDAGQWVAISANMLEDGHNCLWLFNYPHEALAGGSMYTVHLPDAIPGAGTPAGPPLQSAWRNLGGNPDIDFQAVFMTIMRDPQQLQATMDRMIKMFQAANRKKQ